MVISNAIAIITAVIVAILVKIAGHRDWRSRSRLPPSACYGLRKPGLQGNPVFRRLIPLRTLMMS